MTARILKKQDVVIQGTAAIGSGANSFSPSPAKPVSSAADASGRKVNAKIVEKTNDYLMLEITCSCGVVSYLKCQYAKNVNENINTENQS